MRPILIIGLMLFTSACAFHKSELDEALEWMDNTYNKRNDVIGARGHGRLEWYLTDTKVDRVNEIMDAGQQESFTYKGCEMTLVSEDLPESKEAQRLEVYMSFKVTFNLRDIAPSSITVEGVSIYGGFPCALDRDPNMTPGCNLAHMSFSTHSKGTLIREDRRIIYLKRTGADHKKNIDSLKTTRAGFWFDDPQYARRFAKAFAHAVELCGGRSAPF